MSAAAGFQARAPKFGPRLRRFPRAAPLFRSCKEPEPGVPGAESTVYNNPSRGVAQPGSASALGAEGREFESLRPDQQNKQLSEAPFATP